MAKARMSQKAFFKVLSELAANPQSKLLVDGDKRIRQKRKVEIDGHSRPLCPIECVYKHINGKAKDYMAAGQELGFSTQLVHEIAMAADNSNIKGNRRRLRNLMLKAVGLE